MKRFIACFDFLGFKEFILNSDTLYQEQIVNNIYRDIEFALSKRRRKKVSRGYIPDLSNSYLNCTTFSDTVVIWTNDDSLESLDEIIEVSFYLNLSNVNSFPLRGSIVYGDIFHKELSFTNKMDSKYNVNSLFGKGVVDAYTKAEYQEWAGTVIDESVENYLENIGLIPELRLKKYAMKYKVPYKPNSNEGRDEFAFLLSINLLTQEMFLSIADRIKQNFSNHNKQISNPTVMLKLENTLQFLKNHLPNE